MKWTSDDIPDQRDRIAIVTGANSGIGYETARALAHKGARVIMACRDRPRGESAAARIRAESPAGAVAVEEVDLGNLAAVEAFAGRCNTAQDRLDLLVANAGVMMPRRRSQTDDGFELQLGTNHLGHFALIGRLLPVLLATAASRVVVVSSAAHKLGTMDFDDLMWESRPYQRMKSYGQSKLANLLFMYELRRRLARAGAGTIAAAAHPGWTATNLQRDVALFRWFGHVLAMPPAQGALPTLYAATAAVSSGEYFGPSGWMEMRGWPVKVEPAAAARDETAAARLWRISEELTGVRYLDA